MTSSSTRRLLVLGALAFAGSAASAQSVDTLGVGRATGITPDGGTVVGGYANTSSPDQTWLWADFGGGTLLPLDGEDVRGVSAGGGVVIGRDDSSGTAYAARWVAGQGWTSLGGVGQFACGQTHTTASDVSWDGNTVVGLGYESCLVFAFKWTLAGGMTHLPKIGGKARAHAVSPDGGTVGGWDSGTPSGSNRCASVWFPDGSEQLILVDPVLNPNGYGEVLAFSSDGTVAIGLTPEFMNLGAFRWDAVNGVQYLGDVPGFTGTAPVAISDDGKTIVGNAGSAFTGIATWIWREGIGFRLLDTYAASVGANFPAGQITELVGDMTPDGQHIVGTMSSGPFTPETGFRLNLPEPCGFNEYGAGASPTNVLTLSGSGATAIGGTADIVTGNLTGPTAYTVLALGQGSLPLFGGVLLVDPLQAIVTIAVPAAGSTATLPLFLPNDPGIVGADLFFQSLALDITQPELIALSNGLQLTICP